MTEEAPRVSIHYHRLPDRLDIFEQYVLEDGEDVVVTFAPSVALPNALTVGGSVILEPEAPVVWFTFPGAWHDIGRFHRADGTFTGVYANILTPPEMGAEVWHTTDLFLDVWLPARGPVTLLDEDEFERARTLAQMDAGTARKARAEADRLMAAARSGAWPPPVVDRWPLAVARERLAEFAAASDPGPASTR